VGFVLAVGAEEQSASVEQPGEGALDDPAVATEAGAVRVWGAEIRCTPRGISDLQA
jgi:hypothetical protein